MPPAIRVGCSGWNYKHWRGPVYPSDVPARLWFEHYAARFDTVEINNSFYRLPEPATFAAWRERAPANFHLNLERLETFLAILPRTLGEIGGQPCARALQHTMEFRHPSWYVDETYAVLKAHDVALCIHDKAGAAITSPIDGPFLYVRFHGPGGRYFGRYERRRIADWADRLAEQWRGGRDVYAYFNNDPQGMAVFNAEELREEMRVRLEAL